MSIRALRKVRAVLAALVLVSVALPVASSVAGADPPPITAAYVDGEDSWLGNDDVLTFEAPDGFVFVEPWSTNGGQRTGVRIHINGTPTGHQEGRYSSVLLVAPAGETLGVGQYDVTVADQAYGPAMSASVDSRGCSTVLGRFEIHEFAQDQDGTVTSLAVDIRAACDGETVATYIDVRFASTVPLDAVRYDPARLAFGEVDLDALGDPAAIDVWNTGTTTQAISARLGGSHPGDYRIVTDGCAPSPIPPGGSCTVTVRFAPGTRGSRDADLFLDDGTARGWREVDLIGMGMGPTTTTLDVESTSTYPHGLRVRAVVPQNPRVGQVRFVVDGETFATFPLSHTPDGVTETFLSMEPGTRTIEAVYDGAAPFQSSRSAVRTHVADRGTRTSITVSPVLPGGGPVRVFAAVDLAGPDRPSGGTLTLRDLTSGSLLATTPVTPGATSLRATLDGIVGHTLRAAYSGHGDQAGSSADIVVGDGMAPTVALRLASGSYATGDATIQIQIDATDSAPSSGLDAMRFSADGTTWGGWQLFAPERMWTFTGTDGLKRLYVQVRDRARNLSNVASDTIYLDRVAPTATLDLADGSPAVAYSVVPWTIQASDPAPSSGVAAMRFRSSERYWWSEWLSFASSGTHHWALTDAPWSLEVQVRDAAGNVSDAAIDTVDWDGDPPTAEVILADGAVTTRDLTVDYELRLDDIGAGVTKVRFAVDDGSWGGWVAAVDAGTWTFSSRDGSRALRVQSRDAAGNVSPVAVDDILIDRAGPAVRIPGAAFIGGTTLTNGRLPMRIGFATTDAVSGVATYQLQRRNPDGSHLGLVVPPAATSLTETLIADGRTHTYRTRATDVAGNVNAWGSGGFSLRRLESSSASFRYAGSWTTRTSSVWSSGSVRSSSTIGASARLTFTGRSIAIVGATGPDRGRVAVSIDGKSVGVLDLYAPTTSYRTVVFAPRFGSGTHELTLRVLDKSSVSTSRRVDLDAVVVLR